MKEISKEERDIIASNIVKLCKEKGIKYTFIANKLGIKKQVFDKIIHGTRHISADELKIISESLNVTQKFLKTEYIKEVEEKLCKMKK
jgi:cyanate lyase